MIATMRGFHRLVKLLRESTKNGVPSVADFQGLHPLHLAVRNEHLSLVKDFLMSEDADGNKILNREDASGFTPLGTAIQMLHHHLRDNDKDVIVRPEKVEEVTEEELGRGRGRTLGNRPVQVYRVVRDATREVAGRRVVVPLEVMSEATRVAIDVEEKGDDELEVNVGSTRF